MLRLHDTAVGQVVELRLRQPDRVSMYVCGPTVYDEPHLGHGRFALVWDILRRYLEWRGLKVHFVSNITDIDDKIIERARQEERSPEEVAAQYEEAWYRALDALGVRRPDEDPHATSYVEPMVGLIDQLVDQDIAYETSNGVYFRVEKVDDYGLLAHQPLESLVTGARVEVEDEKQSPLDFALWKKSRPGEPSWPSPWGPGRPGWHTECVVMALDLLGEEFDLHGGGLDLAFPHHENERAQARAVGRRFARHWVHSGFVMGPGGEKMSKSLGNYTSLTELLERADPRAYRLLVLQSHYRKPLEVSPATIESAEGALARLDELARRAGYDDLSIKDDQSKNRAGTDSDALQAFSDHMDDDLGTPAAMSLLFDLVGRANSALDRGEAQVGSSLAMTALEMARAVGLEPRTADGSVDDETIRLVRERDEARSEGDYSKADRIREQLVAMGWKVKDGPTGTAVHR